MDYDCNCNYLYNTVLYYLLLDTVFVYNIQLSIYVCVYMWICQGYTQFAVDENTYLAIFRQTSFIICFIIW